MRDQVRESVGDEEAWIVGGAVRDELLGRPVVDLDVALAEPEQAARRFARSSGGAPLSDTTIGVPQASDSTSAIPNESASDGRAVTHAFP